MSRRILLAAALCFALSPVVSCSPRMAHALFSAAVITAAIIGTAHVLAHHDAHFHDPYCGHHRRWHSDRWVYYYDGHWEYYEPETGRWYFYQEQEDY